MRHERQIELLRRLESAKPSLDSDPWPQAAACVRHPASTYTDPERFEREKRVLFRQGMVALALTDEMRQPGSYITADMGGVPVVVIRQRDGSIRGFVNACRHRGASIASGCGKVANSLTCPYHAWTYGLDGALKVRPGAEPAFDDEPREGLGLLPIEVAEGYGFIFGRAEGPAFTADEALAGAQLELADYGLENYHLFETRTNEWAVNWKMILDTFLESYHIRTLHRDSIWPEYLYNTSIFDGFGPHPRNIGLLRSVLGEFEKPEAERALLPHATTQYILVPSGLITYQRNHIQLWRVTPLAVNRTRVMTSIFTAEKAETEKAQKYWSRNMDALVGVTGREDFPLMEQIQANLSSGALPELVFGKLEPGLIHFHEAVQAALDKAAT
ncbi:aromatic ring-hydroxylating oxygenase subunit alpha [Zavarzinia sp. CC-PAN008]|uniref:aromatic ring-hydroxylating oxygenase subunit alpha n=1 Tax=Zavarzinia sp. CC-PAN008 TaxID=3243332 RepID=UPI003F74739D